MTTEEWYYLNNGVRMSLVEVGKQFPVDFNRSTGFFLSRKCIKTKNEINFLLLYIK